MLKKIFTAGILSCALAACSLVAAAGQTMADYDNVKGVSCLSRMDAVDIAEARRTAPELKEVGDWFRRVGYYLGDKDYAITTGWAPQKVQLITPYSLTKYLEYDANSNLSAPDRALLAEVAKFKDIAWVWVWSNGSYGIINTDQPAPVVTNVVMHTPDNTFHYYLDKEQYMPVNALAKAKVNTAQLWPFPAKLFSKRNVPLEIIIVDDKGNKKPLVLGNSDLDKCK